MLIDQCKDVGVTTVLKNLTTLQTSVENVMMFIGWDRKHSLRTVDRVNEAFSSIIPLNKIFSLMEDYKKYSSLLKIN